MIARRVRAAKEPLEGGLWTVKRGAAHGLTPQCEGVASMNSDDAVNAVLRIDIDTAKSGDDLTILCVSCFGIPICAFSVPPEILDWKSARNSHAIQMTSGLVMRDSLKHVSRSFERIAFDIVNNITYTRSRRSVHSKCGRGGRRKRSRRNARTR
jgi:hypothetical protein